MDSSVSYKSNKIQILRGLAIIAVVVIHSAPEGKAAVVLRPFVNYAVAMFLFLSGYLTKIDISDYKAFIVKRIKRVLVPYCIWSVVYMIPYGFEGFWIKLLTGRCCGIFYYIFVYMQFVLLTPLIIKLIKSKYRWIGWTITPLLTIVFRYVMYFNGYRLISSNFNYLFAAWFVYYFIGLLLGNNIITIRKNNVLYIITYVLLIAISICEGYLWYGYGSFDMATTQLRLTSMGTSLITIVFAYRYLQNTIINGSGLVANFLKILGDASFGIYLSHIAIIGVLSRLLPWGNIVFPINTLLVLVVSAVCVMLGNKILRKSSWILGI